MIAESSVGIESLDLSHNELVSLPPDVGALTSLTSLDISHNSLDNMPGQMVPDDPTKYFHSHENEVLA